ncbi:hypothetical protein AAF712_002785 [Marasmius tenuissimus]|uniref:MYND-type domain-containing protein n=1 Tax=Marasmius tenuissimus TaxID=585030 RepID=A0ABR3ABA6_9AGAR
MPGDTVAKSFTVDPSKLNAGSVVVLNNATNEPTVTTIDEIKKGIQENKQLARPCGSCKKTPEKGQAFAHCSKCRETHYCSRKSQTAHWPEHKAICKHRVKVLGTREKAKVAALAEGKTFYDLLTLQAWYRLNNIIEHAIRPWAFHVLELWKGRSSSIQATRFVLSAVEVSELNPEDVELVRFKDAIAVPMDKLQSIGSPPPQTIKESVERGFMVLVFVDVKHNLRVLELHESPSSEPYLEGEKQPDEMWQVHTAFKLNSHLSSMD